MMRTVHRGRSARARRWAASIAVAAGTLVAGCESSQDPGLDPGLIDGPAPTSDTLPDCPAGGPDATTPPAGCLGPDGAVLRP
jgi:hypothetical protein